MRKFRIFVLLAVVLVGLFGTTTAVFASPFLCPVVGDGVINADDKNGDNGVFDIGPDVGTSILPAGDENQAGANANPSSYNTQGPCAGAGPGGNPDYSPIWPTGDCP